MDGDRHLGVVTRESGRLAAAIRGDVAAPVRRYPRWSVADLGRHVGQVHRWVTGAVATGATERPPRPDVSAVADADVPGWLEAGAHALVETLAQASPEEPVWTISRDDGTVGFWRRRMAIETTLHRWDAEDAVAEPGPVPQWLALEAVDEALHIYLVERLAGADVGGSGQRLQLDCGAGRCWSVTFRADGVAVEVGVADGEAVIQAPPLDVWLLLTGRRSADEVTVTGDRAVAELCVRVADMVPGPA